ncbi:hypothetical protein KCP75_26190 [Salmonella enterica subsp. enterica]|nr:hypothetical protein KCP75_26190 [Salmonella enterica subsp. enterica]
MTDSSGRTRAATGGMQGPHAGRGRQMTTFRWSDEEERLLLGMTDAQAANGVMSGDRLT